MYTKTQIQRLRFYRFAMSLSASLIIVSLGLLATDTHANSTIRVCERNFIGTEYKPYLAKKCDLIWKHLSYQILPTNK